MIETRRNKKEPSGSFLLLGFKSEVHNLMGCGSFKMGDNAKLIETIQAKLLSGASVAEVLRYLSIDCSIEDQVELMNLMGEALGVGLGAVTAIAGWWHEGVKELNDEDVNAYITPLVDEWRRGL